MSRLTRLSRPGGFVVALVASLALGVAFATAAYAHHPEITASSNCDGTVTFVSEAWESSNPDQRTNPDIRISVSTNGGPFVDLPAKPAYHYNAANDYQFTDTFTPAAGWTTVSVRATAMASWASGASAGDSRTTPDITPQTDCLPPAAPAAVIPAVECSADGVTVQLTNTGGESADFTISNGSISDVVSVPGGETVNITVELVPDTTTVITITAEGMETVTRELSTICAAAPVATTVAPTTTTAAPTTTTVAPEASGGGDDARDAEAAAALAAAREAALAAGDVSGQLPATGSSTTGVLLLGLASLAAGGVLVVASRRSRDARA